MGRDKAMIRVGKTTLLHHTYTIARRIFPEIVVVSSFHEAMPGLDVRMIRDVLPVSGSLTGIVSALLAAETPYVFVLSCDMPFLSERAIRHVLDANHGENIIIPQTEAGLEPMHAIYNRCCISTMLSAIGRDHMKISRLLPYFSVRTVPSNPLFFNEGISVFMNVNTAEDLHRAEQVFP
jgi:molybdopterin-guanine dinucleotide biosynthesis protein A